MCFPHSHSTTACCLSSLAACSFSVMWWFEIESVHFLHHFLSKGLSSLTLHINTAGKQIHINTAGKQMDHDLWPLVVNMGTIKRIIVCPFFHGLTWLHFAKQHFPFAQLSPAEVLIELWSKKALSNEPFLYSIVLKALLVHKMLLCHHYHKPGRLKHSKTRQSRQKSPG